MVYEKCIFWTDKLTWTY